MINICWAALGVVAMLWPARLAGPLAGIPLETPLDAAVLGALAVLLIIVEPRVLSRWSYRVGIVLLVVWKAATAAALVQDGWCLRFETPRPVYRDMGLVPHTWDARADWRSPTPACSAVMTRGYPSLERFPVWFYNLPPGDREAAPTPDERPPLVTLRASLDGFLAGDRPGVLRVALGDDVRADASVDAVEVSRQQLTDGVSIGAGSHHVVIRASLDGQRWRVMPTWNGAPLWRAASPVAATIAAPTAIDRLSRPWGRFVPALLIAWILGCAMWQIAQRARSVPVLGFVTAMSAVAGGAAATGRLSIIRALPILLAAAAAIPVPRRIQNRFGGLLLVAVPFTVLIAVLGLSQAGFVTFYTGGDDWWMFQRYAYRIFMQGYWLEGGQPTFWFQPLYRWIAGGLHMVFGDSSVGEMFWDAACLLAGATFAFVVTRAFAGFRWGLIASVTTLAVFSLGPAWYLVGRGLSEISSAGLLYAAALLALRGRHGYWPAILAAGILAVLAFYTRLNNLPMVAGVALFAWPVSQPIGCLLPPGPLVRRVSPRVFVGVLALVALGLLCFAWRTWYYTGVFSLFYGTQASARSLWQTTNGGESPWHSITGSVLMVLTMNDPPRLDVRAVPIIVGVAAAVLGLLRVRPFATLPLNVAGLCLAGMSGALVARGTAYPGRFSVHLIPVTVALSVCALSLFVGRSRQRHDRAP